MNKVMVYILQHSREYFKSGRQKIFLSFDFVKKPRKKYYFDVKIKIKNVNINLKLLVSQKITKGYKIHISIS